MTDTSNYIEEIFDTSEEKKELFLYDVTHPESIPDNIAEALGDSDLLYGVADRGFVKADDMLSWKKRADEVIRLMEIWG